VGRCPSGFLVLTAALLFGTAGPAAAGQARFRYVPVDAAGNTTLVTPVSGAGPGERVRWFGAVRQPYDRQPRPTHLVTYRHPYTNRDVTVPVSFPGGTPRLEYRSDRVIYNYGSYTVEAQFFPDGSVDVVYDSGLLRPP
jgi:hypothetical protein